MPVKATTYFATSNKWLDRHTYSMLLRHCANLRLGDIQRIAIKLNVQTQLLDLEDGLFCNIEDLCSMYGENMHGVHCGPLGWYGGPQLQLSDQEWKAGQEPFTYLTGTARTWITDCLLYEFSHGDLTMTELVRMVLNPASTWSRP